MAWEIGNPVTLFDGLARFGAIRWEPRNREISVHFLILSYSFSYSETRNPCGLITKTNPAGNLAAGLVDLLPSPVLVDPIARDGPSNPPKTVAHQLNQNRGDIAVFPVIPANLGLKLAFSLNRRFQGPMPGNYRPKLAVGFRECVNNCKHGSNPFLLKPPIHQLNELTRKTCENYFPQ
ncbi:MAG: hypothetical protein ACO3CL_08190 [Bacteroidia bacterium]